MLPIAWLVVAPSLHCSSPPSYVGCFTDCAGGGGPFGTRAMPHNAGNLPTTDSAAHCATKCSGWEYIGLQDGQDCFCGNGTGFSSQGVSPKCTTPCTGNSSEVCGGPCANSVYWIGAGPAPAPPPPKPPGPPLPPHGSEADPSPHDIVWQTPSSTGARGALPLGNGECSASLWVEPNGDLLMYAVKSDSFDEVTSRDKLARLRVRFDPPLQTSSGFQQRLALSNASVAVETEGVRVEAFVDANSPALRLRAQSKHGDTFRLHASLEVWRAGPAPAQGSFCQAWNRSGDVLLNDGSIGDESAIGVVHVNADETSAALINETLARQGIDMGGAPVYNPMHGRSFGAWITGVAGGTKLKRVNSTTLSSERPAAVHSLVLSMLTTVNSEAGASLEQWVTQAAALAHTNGQVAFETAASRHASEWKALWERSWVWVSTNSSSFTSLANASDSSVVGDPTAVLTLQRYLDLANGRQALYPIHGGGQAWGADGCVDDNSPLHPCTDSDNPCPFPTNSGVCNPDNYNWWTYYWQEGRHPYYSALPAGDGVDMLPALYRVYAQTLPLHQARVRSWYNHSGAVFPERFYLFGPIDSPTYGCNIPPRSPDLATGLYQKYHIMGTLALCSLGLDDWDYHSGAPATAEAARERMKEFIIPICLNATTYYFEHYHPSGPGGKQDMFPSQGEETWQCPNPHNRSQCTTNPASDIAGLWAVTDRLLQLDDLNTASRDPMLTVTQTEMLLALRQVIPELPAGARPQTGGYSKFAPSTERVYLPASAVPSEGAMNAENIELHGVFPFRLAHLNRTLMDLVDARATYTHRMFPCTANTDWCEDGNVAALLGLTEQAGEAVVAAVSSALLRTSPGWRFPLWHAGGGDTTPTMMPQSILRQTLHSMLLQHTPKGELLLFPSWPAGWDVSFKLHAPRGTVVQGRCTNGTVEGLLVTPASRLADVRVLGCEKNASAARAAWFQL